MKEKSLFHRLLEEAPPPPGPVTCLGMTFQNDEARRAHFTAVLREKLRDPEFRKIEGFPIGGYEDILALSDPPYYTACPNPWIAAFIAEWEAQKPLQPKGYHYHREPFAADVTEGKNDPVYKAHSYHTKVPHKAIMRYILHYTLPGDIVFDGFCGTGMTGVAAQMCGDREVVMSLGYHVTPDGTILQKETGDGGKPGWRPFSKLGVRRTVLSDLSPAATFISYSYNTPVDGRALEQEATRVLVEVTKECSWMYETKHIDGRIGKINYTIWSDVFSCPECAGVLVFWDVAVDKSSWQVMEAFECPHCTASLSKRALERRWESKVDPVTKDVVQQAKQVPALIHYKIGPTAFTKKPDKEDISLLDRTNHSIVGYWYPSDKLPVGFNTTQPQKSHGIYRVDDFFTNRALAVLASYASKVSANRPLVHLTSALLVLSKLYRFRSQGGNLGAGGGPMNGTLYVPSLIKEIPVVKVLRQHIERASKASVGIRQKLAAIGTGSFTEIWKMADDSMDYLFLDPPFGANINYSELNFIWESWLKVWTNNKEEAVENPYQKKGAEEYRHLMARCFSEAYRVLKAGHWMTVEFSNTKASVWNSIQNALTGAGFIVGNVSALDKKQGSFKAVTTPTAVKQDLIISAYKPNGGFEERFQKEAQTEEGIWDFVRTHLKYLPVAKQQGGSLQFVPERDPRILFDQMVAYYVRMGYPVPISSHEFQVGVAQRFSERDGMYFLPDQVGEYDDKKMNSSEPSQMTMFVSDEVTAIHWLRRLMKQKPQTFSEINPQFMQQLGGWSKTEAQLDLRVLLNQNFLCYDGNGPVPEQIHAYLSTNWKELRNLPKDEPALVAKARDRWYVPDPKKAGDLEKLREKALLKEFEEYKEIKKQLKVFRLEAVRAGFMKAWQERDYAVIMAVAAKIPTKVLEEDQKLVRWYDGAITRMGRE